jgi:hypothetical protein
MSDPPAYSPGGALGRSGAAQVEAVGGGLEIRDDVPDQVVQLLGERHPHVAH